MQSIHEILPLTGKVQHYAWGGRQFLPQLLRINNTAQQPFAEYWMGAHPSAPSQVGANGSISAPLNQLIASNPARYLGQAVNNRFHELPYLFKILDVHDMLSIQVHPTRQGAEQGYDAEEAAGIPINAPHRNYKDRNHKPEVMVALSEFWLLHGFKGKEAITETLGAIPEFNFLLPVFEAEGYYGLYKTVMEMPQAQVDEVLYPLVERQLAWKDTLPKNDPGFWVARLFGDQQPLTNIDRGIFSIYFFNLVQVQPGEAVFQGAGIPHAYLYGQNVELMANSDNVLRGGLTPKHIDVPELLKHTLFEPVVPNVMQGEQQPGGERLYPCPVPDFGIAAIQLAPGQQYSATSYSVEIFIVTEGSVQVQGSNLGFARGQAFAVMAGVHYTITSADGGTMYKAFVPAT